MNTTTLSQLSANYKQTTLNIDNLPINQIILGDALSELKKLPSNSIDIGVTSPPYNKGEKQKGWLVANVLYDNSVDKKEENLYQQEQIEVLNQLYRVIKPGGSFFYNHKIRWEKGLLIHPMEWISQTQWAIRQEIIWDRCIAANIRGWRFWQVEERIYWLFKPQESLSNKSQQPFQNQTLPKINVHSTTSNQKSIQGKNLIGDELNSKHALLTSIWRFPPEKKSQHPAPYPLQLPVRCIYSLLDDKKDLTVIDPYAGSGTTLVAAKFLSHNYIGIELSPHYIDLASNRLKNYQNEKETFEEEYNKHIVKETFTQRKARGVYNHHNKATRQSKKSTQTKTTPLVE